jgi:oxalate decarboxylase
MVDDWIAHTPKDILAKNFGVNASVFSNVPATDPYIVKGDGEVSSVPAKSPYGALTGNSSYVYHASEKPVTNAPGGGGTIQIIDSRNFPISQTIAAAIVTLDPGALRELHWHPTVGKAIRIFHTRLHRF